MFKIAQAPVCLRCPLLLRHSFCLFVVCLTMNTLAESWYVIAEQASKEMDPEKLLILADRLCKAFDEEHARVANLDTVNWMISSSGS
jgi:hypothetical protein